jgi:hypothetical protein
MPGAFALQQNYPNPFNPSTLIRYTVGGVGNHLPAGQAGASGVSGVTLAVYDVLGREVAVLVHEQKAPGTYTVQFDGAGQPSGMYVYRLQANGVSASKTMMLVK